MSNPFDDFSFHAKDSLRFGLRAFIVPFVIIVCLSTALAGALYMINSKAVPTEPPDLTDPAIVGQEASTDMYGNALLSAFNCVQNYKVSACDKDKKKSNLIISASEEILVVNGKEFPVTDQKEVREIFSKKPFTGIDYLNMTTPSKGKKVDELTYSNDQGQEIVMMFDKNDKGEVILEKMEITG